MKTAIIGSGELNGYHHLKECLDNHIVPISCIMTGTEETMAKRYARERNIPVKIFMEDYYKHGFYATIRRYFEICDESEQIILFGKGRDSEGARIAKMSDTAVFEY